MTDYTLGDFRRLTKDLPDSMLIVYGVEWFQLYNKPPEVKYILNADFPGEYWIAYEGNENTGNKINAIVF
jgi:hypothetical protein